MILDDGGDATMLVHLGLRAEQGDMKFLDGASNEEEEVLFALIKRTLKEKPGWFAKLGGQHQRRIGRDHNRRSPALSNGQGRPPVVPGD